MHGTAYANYAVMNSEIPHRVGARFDDRVTGKLDVFALRPRWSTSISIRRKSERMWMWISPSWVMPGTCFPPWWSGFSMWSGPSGLKDRRVETGLSLAYEERDDEIAPQYVVEQIYEITKGQAIIATEVGQNQMWAAQYYRFDEPRCFVSSGGLGTMGYGFPAAIGAQVGRPDRTVIDIAGDGSFQMNIQELGTVASNRIPVKVVILNNGCLGMVRQWQQLFYKERYSYIDLRDNPDFVQIAAAYGIKGRRITKREEVRPVLEEMLALPEPVVIDVQVCRGANVYPMVPAGGALDKMLGLGRE